MGDAYADAIVRLEDEVIRAVSRAEPHLTAEEIAKELRRIADETEAPASISGGRG